MCQSEILVPGRKPGILPLGFLHGPLQFRPTRLYLVRISRSLVEFPEFVAQGSNRFNIFLPLPHITCALFA